MTFGRGLRSRLRFRDSSFPQPARESSLQHELRKKFLYPLVSVAFQNAQGILVGEHFVPDKDSKKGVTGRLREPFAVSRSP